MEHKEVVILGDAVRNKIVVEQNVNMPSIGIRQIMGGSGIL